MTCAYGCRCGRGKSNFAQIRCKQEMRHVIEILVCILRILSNRRIRMSFLHTGIWAMLRLPLVCTSHLILVCARAWHVRTWPRLKSWHSFYFCQLPEEIYMDETLWRTWIYLKPTICVCFINSCVLFFYKNEASCPIYIYIHQSYISFFSA